MKRASILSLLSFLAVLAGCATNPADNHAVQQARAAVQAAQSDPQVASLAPAELDLAVRTLHDAERLARDSAPGEFVSHRAYVAEQRARIARESAMARAAEQQTAQAREERRARLEARAREAEAARLRAEAQARESRERLQAMEQARQAEQSKRLASAEQLGAQVRGLESQLPELDARETERGWVLAISPELMFDRGEATLKPSGRRALEGVARVLRQHPGRNILVEGFADDAGGADLNRHLSERRAHAVRNALVLAGVDGAHIVARGAGAMESGPAARVQIVIAPEPAGAAAGGGSR